MPLMNMPWSASFLLRATNLSQTWVRGDDWEIIKAWNCGTVLSLNA
jgi:hypothetical protein